MPNLEFSVVGAEAVPYAVAPSIALKLRVEAGEGRPVRGISLDCQVRIDAHLRRYSDEEKNGLQDLFGAPARWGQTLRSLLWTHASTNVPAFDDEVLVDLLVPCSYDFNIIGTKYFHGIQDGIVPLTLLFSGTVFYEAETGGLQIERISWSKEATYPLPVRTWKDLMEMYYPNIAWLPLRRDVFDRVNELKTHRGLPTIEAALEALLQQQQAPA